MKKKAARVMCLILAGIMLSWTVFPALLAAAETDTVFIRTAEDLADLAENCTLDSWSRTKTVFLENDIDLTDEDFSPIPTFGGTFEGQGHTISGISLTESGDVQGFFRYIQSSGTVRNLTVEGEISPSDRKNTLGGIAGSNRGTIDGCSFDGTVSGADSIGGLTGINELEGQIINCSFSGSVTGEHYAGGIAGQNLGTVIQCENSGSINTTEVDAEIDPENINREQINSAENVPSCTDVGGIAGFSSGILQGCSNTGNVGYPHAGYNIGGIAGRQSGYLNGCKNSGTILGRKDTGGIAGQLEPEITLLYNQGDMNRLLDELDVLHSLADQTGYDIRVSSDVLSERLQSICDNTEEAYRAADDFADSLSGWISENAEAVDSYAARVSWFIDEISFIMQDTSDAAELTEKLAGQLDTAMQEASETGALALDTAEQFREAADDLKSVSSHLKKSAEHLKEALQHLREILGQPEQMDEASSELKSAVRELSDDLSDASGCLTQMHQILQEAESDMSKIPEWNDLTDKLGLFASSLSSLSSSLQQIENAADCIFGDDTDDKISEAAENAAASLSAAGESFRKAGEELSAAIRALFLAADEGRDAAGQLHDLMGKIYSFTESLQDTGDTFEELSSLLSDTVGDLSDVFQELSEQPSISLHPLDSSLREQEDDLKDALTGVLDSGTALNQALSDTSDTLLDGLDAISDQIGVITDLLRDILTDSGEKNTDPFEDVSGQESGGSTGTISHCENSGAVRGDINAGGIAGSMAVEYDFDPEDDLVREGDSSSDFRLQTRAVIISCLNSGEITGKKDYAGGITGSADLGRISSCENYGSVTSTDGDYVGGIAGASQGSIDSCWSKCSLAGGDYVGGTAGLATELNNCHTLVTISEGTAYLGSVAGFAAEDATLSGNTFTGSLGAVDGISYEGKAAPVDFDTLCMTAGVPDLFSRLELTFTADGDTVAVVSLQYGKGVESLPEIPAKKGYSARWPDIDYTCITASQTLEAVYTPYSSALTDGGELPDILVDGSFSSSASVTHTEEEVTWTDENGVPSERGCLIQNAAQNILLHSGSGTVAGFPLLHRPLRQKDHSFSFSGYGMVFFVSLFLSLFISKIERSVRADATPVKEPAVFF